MKRFHIRRPRLRLGSGLLMLGAVAFGLAAPAAATCVGDCNGNGIVSIDEAQACVNLGNGLPAPACAAADQNNDGQVEANEVDACIQSFLNPATCAMVFTPVPTPTNTAPPPPTSTNTPPPPTSTGTVTNTPDQTATFTAAPTATTTPTSGVVVHTCTLAGAGKSKIDLYTEGIGDPISFNLSGSLSLGAGGSSTSCDIVTLSPVNIVGIGFVCISAGGPCAPGTRWCGPGSGPALGIDSQSDGNTGTCTNNTACQTICNGTCGGAANVQTAGCTGFCSGTSPANQACTSDSQCLPSNGACNGPEPVPTENAKICQCSCINTAAHGASDAGDFQCNLGSNIVVETAAPCNGTDILINVGNTCIPVSTEEASGLVTNSNFNACGNSPCTVPVPGITNDQTGVPIACTTMDASTVTGFVGVGAVNFFGSTLGDLSVGLKSTCQ